MEHVITESPYLCSPNILWHPDCQTKAVALDFAGTGGCIKAGSPISAAGKVANDASAVGVLLHDAHELCCSHGLVVIGGYIKSDIAQSHSGIEISDAARSAMSRLAFIGADGIPQPAAGGGVFTVTFNIDFNSRTWTADKTYDEILAALHSEKPVIGFSAGTQFTVRIHGAQEIDLVAVQDSTAVINEGTSPATITVGVAYYYILLERNGNFDGFLSKQEVSGTRI